MMQKVVSGVFILLGTAFLCGAVYWYFSTADFVQHAVSVEGTVVELQAQRSQNGTTYAPVASISIGQARGIPSIPRLRRILLVSS